MPRPYKFSRIVARVEPVGRNPGFASAQLGLQLQQEHGSSSAEERCLNACRGCSMSIRVVSSGAPRPLANYIEAFVAGDLCFAAGQLASDFKEGIAAQARRHASFPYYGSDIELQTTYVLENLKKTFEAAGSSLDHAVKAQVFLTDLNDFHGFDTVWK